MRKRRSRTKSQEEVGSSGVSDPMVMMEVRVRTVTHASNLGRVEWLDCSPVVNRRRLLGQHLGL